MSDLRRPAPQERIGLPLEGRPAPAAASAPPPRTAAWTGVGNSVPRLTQTPEGEVRSAFVASSPDDEHDIEPMPDNDTGLLSVTPKTSGATITTHSTLEEPWWVVFGERITGDRRILIGVGVVLVLIAALVFWPRANASVRLHDIRKNPDQWEGRSVKVSGRVGDDVFPLGSGYVFPLLQGRDTIVVFTRTRTPERRQRVTVIGEVSAGYLDGRARLAILENPTP